MTPQEQTLDALVKAGACVADYTQGGLLTVPIYGELVRPADGSQPFFYWFEADAEDQHHTHARAYDEVAVVNGRDLDLHFNGTRVLYVAPFSEWPEISTDDFAERLAIARARLEDPDTKALFDLSVAECRPEHAPTA